MKSGETVNMMCWERTSTDILTPLLGYLCGLRPVVPPCHPMISSLRDSARNAAWSLTGLWRGAGRSRRGESWMSSRCTTKNPANIPKKHNKKRVHLVSLPCKIFFPQTKNELFEFWGEAGNYVSYHPWKPTIGPENGWLEGLVETNIGAARSPWPSSAPLPWGLRLGHEFFRGGTCQDVEKHLRSQAHHGSFPVWYSWKPWTWMTWKLEHDDLQIQNLFLYIKVFRVVNFTQSPRADLQYYLTGKTPTFLTQMGGFVFDKPMFSLVDHAPRYVSKTGIWPFMGVITCQWSEGAAMISYGAADTFAQGAACRCEVGYPFTTNESSEIELHLTKGLGPRGSCPLML